MSISYKRRYEEQVTLVQMKDSHIRSLQESLREASKALADASKNTTVDVYELQRLHRKIQEQEQEIYELKNRLAEQKPKLCEQCGGEHTQDESSCVAYWKDKALDLEKELNDKQD